MREELYKQLLQDASGIFVEIGTDMGYFTEWLRKNTKARAIVTVDPYRKYSMEEYHDALNQASQAQLNMKYALVCAKLKPLGITVARATSYVVSHQFPDNTVTFCYIDGNHHYNAVLMDLIRWWPKIKPGGWLCGDDVESIEKPHDEEGNLLVEHQPGSFGKYGVYPALIDFRKVCPEFVFKIVGNQFIAQKPLVK